MHKSRRRENMDVYNKLLEEYSENDSINKYRITIFLNYVKEHKIPIEDWMITYIKHEDIFMDGLGENSQRIYKPQMKRFITYCINNYETIALGTIIPRKDNKSFPVDDTLPYLTGRITHAKKKKEGGKRYNKPPHNPSKIKRTTRIVDHWSKL